MIAQAEIAAEWLLEIITPSLYTGDQLVVLNEPRKEIIRKYGCLSGEDPFVKFPSTKFNAFATTSTVLFFQHSQLMATLRFT